MEASKTGVMALKDEDMKFMSDIDTKVWAARQTLQVALQVHAAVMSQIADDRAKYWDELRERFSLAEDTEFRLAKIDGFWQIELLDGQPGVCVMEARHAD